MGIKSFINVIALAEKLGINKTELRKEYPKTDESLIIESEAKHRYMVGKAHNLVERMILKGGYDEKDLANAVKYVMVAIDSFKYELDYQKAKRELGISRLIGLYPAIKAKHVDEE